MFWWWWLLLGSSLGREAGKQEGLEEAKRRIDGSGGDGRPTIRHAIRGPPPRPPTKWEWLAAVVLGGLMFGVAHLIDSQIFSPNGNMTYLMNQEPVGGVVGFASGMLKLLRFGLYLLAFFPLYNVAGQWFASQNHETDSSFKFKEDT